VKLTSKSVATLSLPPGKSDHITWDTEIPRFGYRLRLGASGRINRSWIVQYRHAGASRRLLLGSGGVLGAEQARAAAKKALASVELGQDPQQDRSDRRGKDSQTLKAVIADYLAVKRNQVRVRTYGVRVRYLCGSYFRALHYVPVDQVTRKDVATQLTRIMVEHGDTTALLARATLSAFYAWAMTMGIVEHNPVIGTPKAKSNKPRERVLHDEELGRIWKACRDDDYGRIIKLLILTACRRQEIGGMRWSELDLERRAWVLPASRAKNGRQHELPLMPMVLDIIAGVPRRATRDYLFGVSGQNGFYRWSAAKEMLDKRCGVTEWTLHDIRRSVATRMADLGVQPHIIEQVLNHQSGHKRGPAGIYNRSAYAREVRAALALWADHVRALVEGGERKVLNFTPPAS
jgi:integrase